MLIQTLSNCYLILQPLNGGFNLFVAQTHIFMTLDGIPHIKHAQSDNFFALWPMCY